MRTLIWALLIWALALVAGCQPSSPPAAPPAPTAAPITAAPATPAPVAPAAPAAPKVAKRTPPQALTTGRAHAPADIKWEGPVEWTDWATGTARAKAENKPICVLVYADWCPRCRELVPAFADPEVAALAARMVMVRQNSDARPAWLEQLSSFGGYVPRVFFFRADGSLREDLTSSHPRYPYFYTPSGLDALKQSMKAALEG